MCIVFFNLNHSQNSKYKLILAANRDEYLSRPAATTSYWTHHNQSNILAPEDLKCKAGTWFGMTTDGRLATLTNYRQAEGMETPDKRSRGVLPVQFLRNQSNSMETFIHGLLPHENEYNGFSLLLANMSQLQIGFVNNIRHQSVSDISEGLHALTNGTLDEPWPKIIRGKNLMKETMEQFESFLSSSSSSSSNHDPDRELRHQVEQALARIIAKDTDREVRVCGTGAVRILARRSAGDADEGTYGANEPLRQELCNHLGSAVALSAKERYPPLRTMAEGALAHLFGVHLMGTSSYLLTTTLDQIDNSTESTVLRSACKRAGETYNEDMLADEDKDMDVDVDGAF
eukprot:gb/GECH01000124.1/.p1 GENE.gb/GECH01000124.1/~~gb/GECH01000124.1/.p1  ORF type:complete len:344 (+),score=68.12 gb/GECH01000124.1/:1-1032(+)